MFLVPMGDMKRCSRRVYIDLISGRLHIYLSVLFGCLLCSSAVVTPSGNGRIIPSL